MVCKVVRIRNFQFISEMKMITIKVKIQAFSIFKETQTIQIIEHHRNPEFRV